MQIQSKPTRSKANRLSTKTPLPAPGETGVRTFSKAKELAARLGVHPKTISRWANAGRLRKFTVTARTVLYDDAEATALIEASCTTDKRTPSADTPKS